jgi:hypothetical protein
MTMLGGAIALRESPYLLVGKPVMTDDWTMYAHPLDVLLFTRPDLGPVERVMVLVDRIVDEALRKLEP